MKNPLYKTLGLGLIAGMRTMTPLAVLSHQYSNAKKPCLTHSRLKFLQSRSFSTLMNVAATTEFAGDKNSSAPDRTELTGLLGRMASGALAGAATYKAACKNPANGAILGAASAFLFTYLFFYTRKRMTEKTGGNDKIVGMVEDLTALGAARFI